MASTCVPNYGEEAWMKEVEGRVESAYKTWMYESKKLMNPLASEWKPPRTATLWPLNPKPTRTLGEQRMSSRGGLYPWF